MGGRLEAAILAGGKGTRFKPYTDIVPKPMIPVGKDERPVLEYIIAWIASFGVKRFTLLVGHHWKQIRNYFGDGKRLGVEIVYSIDGGGYSGTGGALLKAYREGLFDNCDNLLVWYGDILAPLDVDKLMGEHVSADADVTIALADRYQLPVGVAVVDKDGFIKELREKPWLNIYVTIGVLMLNPRVLDGVEEVLGKNFDIMDDLIPYLLSKGARVKAFIHKGPWYDVGSLERWVKLPNEVLEAIESRVKHLSLAAQP